MFRRSKAFTELGYHFRALNDISYCLRNQAAQVHQTPGVNNFQSYYWEVRTSLGLYAVICQLVKSS